MKVNQACLIANMKRTLEILEKYDFEDCTYWDIEYKELAELKAKLHEVRRDSINLMNDIYGK